MKTISIDAGLMQGILPMARRGIDENKHLSYLNLVLSGNPWD